MKYLAQLIGSQASFLSHGMRLVGRDAVEVEAELAKKLEATGFVRILEQPDEPEAEAQDVAAADAPESDESPADKPLTATQKRAKAAAE